MHLVLWPFIRGYPMITPRPNFSCFGTWKGPYKAIYQTCYNKHPYALPIWTPMCSWNKFISITKMESFGNHGNYGILHKSKMADGRHLGNLTFEPFALENCAICLSYGFSGCRIHFYHYFFNSRSSLYDKCQAKVKLIISVRPLHKKTPCAKGLRGMAYPSR